MIHFVQQLSSVDFQKKELDHAWWVSPGIRVAGVVWEKETGKPRTCRGEGRTSRRSPSSRLCICTTNRGTRCPVSSPWSAAGTNAGTESPSRPNKSNFEFLHATVAVPCHDAKQCIQVS